MFVLNVIYMKIIDGLELFAMGNIHLLDIECVRWITILAIACLKFAEKKFL